MAVINHTYKFIFVHIPKNAGTTITHRLLKYKDSLQSYRQPLNTEAINNKSLIIRKHSTAKQIKRVIGNQAWEDYTKFAFVRPPEERVISTYNFLKYKWRNWKGSEIMDTFDNIEQFITSDFFQTSGPDRILNPQSFWFLDKKQQICLTLYNTKTLEEDYKAITQNLDLPSITHPIRKRMNVSTYSVPTLNSELKAIIYKRYQQDYDIFEQQGITTI